ncbi:MAG: hypothetical protein L0Z53_06550 [Acidobacteriales bacterium]|nr:hypothetical protein [Terriglobales bacterium]
MTKNDDLRWWWHTPKGFVRAHASRNHAFWHWELTVWRLTIHLNWRR